MNTSTILRAREADMFTVFAAREPIMDLQTE